MNHITQVTQILDQLCLIQGININYTMIDNNFFIIDFSFFNHSTLAQIYNTLPGGHIAIHPNKKAAQLTFMLTQQDNKSNAFAYPDEN